MYRTERIALGMNNNVHIEDRAADSLQNIETLKVNNIKPQNTAKTQKIVTLQIKQAVTVYPMNKTLYTL